MSEDRLSAPPVFKKLRRVVGAAETADAVGGEQEALGSSVVQASQAEGDSFGVTLWSSMKWESAAGNSAIPNKPRRKKGAAMILGNELLTL